MTEEQFHATRNVELATKALNDLVIEAEKVGIDIKLDVNDRRSAPSVEATYSFRSPDIIINKTKLFE